MTRASGTPRSTSAPRRSATPTRDRVGHHRRPPGRRTRRHVGAARRDRGRRRASPSCARPTRSRRSAPAGCAWSRSTARKGVPASCTTPCADGMVVSTQTDTVRELRRNVMELYLSDHPEDCDGCARGNCEIQAMAAHGRLRRGALRPARVARRGRPPAAARPEQPLLRLRRLLLHRLLPLRARLRRHPGHLRAHRRGPRLRLQDQRRRHRLHVLRVRLVRRLRAGLPDVRAAGALRSSQLGMPTRSVETTCAYCGVGCSFRAEVQGEGDDAEVVRMIPSKNGGANEGHSCVKGRFAYGYAAHKDRQLSPMVRDTIDDEWRKVSWDEAIAKVADGLQGPPGRARRRRDRRHLLEPVHQRGGLRRPEDGAGGVRQQQHRHLRAGLPLPHRLRPQADLRHLRRHPGLPLGRQGRRDPADRRQPDRRAPGLRLAHEEAAARGRPADRGRPAPDRPGPQPARRGGAPPARPARLQRRLRQRDGPRDRHRGPRTTRSSCASAARTPTTTSRSSPTRCNSPEATAEATGIDPDELRAAARLYATAGNAAIYYGLGVTEHSQGSTMVMGMANLAMVTGNIGREGVGVNPLRGQNNVQGSCDMGSFPHEFPGYRHVSQDDVRGIYEQLWGTRPSTPSRACASPTCSTPRWPAPSAGSTSRARTSRSPTPTPSTSRRRCGRWTSSSSRTCSSTRPRGSPTSSCPARRSWRRTAPSPTPSAGSTGSGRCSPRKVGMDEWEITCAIGRAMGYDMSYAAASEIMDEIAATTPDVRRRLVRAARRGRLDAVAGLRHRLDRHADHAHRRVRARQGQAHRDGRSCRRPSGRPASSR